MVQVKFCFLCAWASAIMPALACVLCCSLDDFCDLFDLVETGWLAMLLDTTGVTDCKLIFIFVMVLPLSCPWC